MHQVLPKILQFSTKLDDIVEVDGFQASTSIRNLPRMKRRKGSYNAISSVVWDEVQDQDNGAAVLPDLRMAEAWSVALRGAWCQKTNSVRTGKQQQAKCNCMVRCV
jgi:hypothetical protein